MIYTVTGATGHLGQRVIQELQKLVPTTAIRATVHTPSKATYLNAQHIETRPIDYLRPDTIVSAITGTDLLIYIPSKTYDLLQRIREFENVLAAMKTAHVSHMIFVSFFADQENNPFVMSSFYGYAPRRLAGSGLNYAIVKNALYADPLIPYLPELIQRQHLIYPVGNESLSFISYQNSAEAIASLAHREDLNGDGQTFLLSQEVSYPMTELGALMSQVTGHTIGYAPVSSTEFAKIYAAEGDGTELASMYQGGAMGLLAQTSNDYQRITGRQPEDMLSFLTTHYSKHS